MKSSRQKSGNKWLSGTNETCDSCKTYIFNLHYMCESCGYMVCLQCYDKRMQRKIEKSCTHSPRKLLPVEIIPARALQFLQQQLPLHLENFRHSSTEEHNHILRHIIISYVFILSLCANFIYFLLSGIMENRMACRHSGSASEPIHVDTCIF
jgi:hypothetical protein